MQINNSMNQTNFGMALKVTPEAKGLLLREHGNKLDELREMAKNIEGTKYYDLVVTKDGYEVHPRNPIMRGYKGDIRVHENKEIKNTIDIEGTSIVDGVEGNHIKDEISSRNLAINLDEVLRQGSNTHPANRAFAATQVLDAMAARAEAERARIAALLEAKEAKVNQFIKDFSA